MRFPLLHFPCLFALAGLLHGNQPCPSFRWFHDALCCRPASSFSSVEGSTGFVR